MEKRRKLMQHEPKPEFDEIETILKNYTQAAPTQPEHAAASAFGEYLQASIQNAGLTRAAAAEAVGLLPATLYAIERGLIAANDLPKEQLLKLAQLLDEDVALFGVLLERTDLAGDYLAVEVTKKHYFRELLMRISKLWRPNVEKDQPASTSQAQIDKHGGDNAERSVSRRPVWRRQWVAFGGLASIALILWIGVASPMLLQTISPQDAQLTGSGGVASMTLQNVQPEQEVNSSSQPDSGPQIFSTPARIPAPTQVPAVVQAAAPASEAGLTSSSVQVAPAAAAENNPALALTLPIVAPTPTAQPTVAQNREESRAPVSPLPTPNAMTFQDYGVNPFIATEGDTGGDSRSTFAIDVDTGSYTLMRSYINNGQLPPPAAIRVEEFINYFDYDYPQPVSEEVFAIHMDVAPAPFTEHDEVEGAGTYQMMRIGVQGYDISKAERANVALTFIIDISGSMEEDGRLTMVKRALSMLVEELRPDDVVGIVVYTDNARILLEPTRAANSNAILDALYTLSPEASTNVADGLRLGYDMAWRHFNPNAVNRVILASDGVANVDVTAPSSMWDQVKQYADRGITLTTIGVGMGNYNDVVMEQLADMGDGAYAYVDDMEEARRLFVDDLVGTLQTIAKDAKIQVEFNPDVVGSYRLLGYENREVADNDFRNDTVDAGEIGAGHSVTALYEVKLRPGAVGTLATAHLRWQSPDSGRISEITETLDSRESIQSFAMAGADFQLAVLVAEFAESLRNSRWVAGQEHSQEIGQTLQIHSQRLANLMAEDEDVAEVHSLLEQAAALR